MIRGAPCLRDKAIAREKGGRWEGERGRKTGREAGGALPHLKRIRRGQHCTFIIEAKIAPNNRTVNHTYCFIWPRVKKSVIRDHPQSWKLCTNLLVLYGTAQVTCFRVQNPGGARRAGSMTDLDHVWVRLCSTPRPLAVIDTVFDLGFWCWQFVTCA